VFKLTRIYRSLLLITVALNPVVVFPIICWLYDSEYHNGRISVAGLIAKKMNFFIISTVYIEFMLS